MVCAIQNHFSAYGPLHNEDDSTCAIILILCIPNSITCSKHTDHAEDCALYIMMIQLTNHTLNSRIINYDRMLLNVLVQHATMKCWD